MQKPKRPQHWQLRTEVFLRRPNRFIAYIEVNGHEEICHVKNTGRCKELLVPGATIYVQHHNDPKRKTQYSLIAVKKGELLINMDSQAPNKVVEEWLRTTEPWGPITLLRPETTYGASRFDFYLETATERRFIEVKGVTLEEEGVVRFPDAPTERGVKHVHELMACRAEGYQAAIVFVVQIEGMCYFTPNWQTHPAFGQALVEARQAGVEVLAYGCRVTPETLDIVESLPINLKY